jgi:hypothetical protein
MKVNKFENYTISEQGDIINLVSGKKLKPWIGRGGYLKICLSNSNKKRWVYIHRLVAENFIPNIFLKPEINHIDGNKLNNNYLNLELVTRSENNIHAFKNGLKIGKRGESNIHHKITEKDVIQIRNLRGVCSQRKLSDVFGISHSHISKIQRRVKWAEVA